MCSVSHSCDAVTLLDVKTKTKSPNHDNNYYYDFDWLIIGWDEAVVDDDCCCGFVAGNVITDTNDRTIGAIGMIIQQNDI